MGEGVCVLSLLLQFKVYVHFIVSFYYFTFILGRIFSYAVGVCVPMFRFKRRNSKNYFFIFIDKSNSINTGIPIYTET